MATGCHSSEPKPEKKEAFASAVAALSGDGGSDAGSPSGCGVTNASNFNGTGISAGNTLWFTSVAKVQGLGSQPVHISVRNAQVQFTAGGAAYNLAVPDGDLTLDPSATTASTTYDTTSNRWSTSVSTSFSGNVFLAGLAYKLPTNLSGGINPVTWVTSFESDTPGITIQWLWAAAVYTQFGTYTALGTKPVDDSSLTGGNSDHAGTPESYKSHVVGGARGGGGSNYTGSLSGTVAVTPSPLTVCTSVCSTAANGTACNDGNACTQNDTCQAGACVGSNPVTCTASDSCHAAGACNPTTGQCSNPAVADGTACSDGNACDRNDTCQAGVCSAGSHVACTALDQCHVAGTCDPTTGQCTNPAASNGTPCNDGNACTQADACQSGACTGSNPVTCTASDQCHVAGACDPSTGQCTNPAASNGTACSDGNACTQVDTCQSGTCAAGSPVTCTASDQCHSAGTCDPSSGQCSNPTLADGTACNDGNACTATDSCRSGSCAGSGAVVCTASDQCHAPGTCDPSSGQCSNPAVADGTACNDGNPCDTNDACKAGSCAGAPVTCTAQDACHTAGTCDPSSGVCSNPTKPSCPPGLPPDPATVAPPLDPTVVSTVYAQTQFLYTASSPDLLIQTGMAPGTISETRVCELHGQVLLQDGEPAPGAVVTVVAHAEYGQTMARADGNYNIVVNGGEAVTLDFAGPGYLPVERTVSCPWQSIVQVPLAVLTPLDPNVTTITNAASGYQVAKGTVETDADGTRQGVLLFPPGTQATATNACGTSTPLSSMSVRITEYTVGTHGPDQMPASLPSTSAYTYAFETSADEALSMGASGVQFNQPVIYYNDNFLKYPVGTGIPLGTYVHGTNTGTCTSGSCSQWVPQNNGIVLGIVSITAGTANLDVSGDGVADSASVLATFGITAGEQQQLALLYPAGKSLWRVQLPHFSAWDSNWGFSPPNDAIAANTPLPFIDVLAKCKTPLSGSSAVDPASQTASESLPIVGTPYSLTYDSARVPGRTAARTVDIPLTGPSIPADLKSVTLQVEAGGNTFNTSFPPAPNLDYTYEWDGKDAFGRELQGAQDITVTIGYVYDGVQGTGPYQSEPRFGHTGNGISVEAIPTRQEVTLPRVTVVSPPAFDETPLGLGGWNVDVHDAYDPSGNVYSGDGTTHAGAQMPAVSIPYAGTTQTPIKTGGTVPTAHFCNAAASAVAPDGSVYVIDSGCPAIYKISPAGVITQVAGTGVGGYNGDEIAATSAQINPYVLGKIAIAPECDGGFYFTDYNNNRLRYVDGKGIIHTIAGNGQGANQYTVLPNNGPAKQYPLGTPVGVAVAPDGSLYVSTFPYCGGCSGLVLRIDTDGILSFFAGSGSSVPSGVLATQATIGTPGPIAVAPNGTVYVAAYTNLLLAVTANGMINPVVGNPSNNAPIYATDGVPVANASVFDTQDLAVAPDGTLYLLVNSFYTPAQIFSLVPGGKVLHTVAGGGSLSGAAANGAPASPAGCSRTHHLPSPWVRPACRISRKRSTDNPVRCEGCSGVGRPQTTRAGGLTVGFGAAGARTRARWTSDVGWPSAWSSGLRVRVDPRTRARTPRAITAPPPMNRRRRRITTPASYRRSSSPTAQKSSYEAPMHSWARKDVPANVSAASSLDHASGATSAYGPGLAHARSAAGRATRTSDTRGRDGVGESRAWGEVPGDRAA